MQGHPHLGVFFAVWAAVGPLAGICLGHLLTRSSHRDQWLRDNRKDECRELLGAIATSMHTTIRIQQEGRFQSPDEQQELSLSRAEVFAVFHTRVFIADEIKKEDLSNKWASAITRYDAKFDVDALYRVFDELNTRLIELALS